MLPRTVFLVGLLFFHEDKPVAIRPFAYLSIAGNRRRQTIWVYVGTKLHEFIELMSCLMDPVLKYFVE